MSQFSESEKWHCTPGRGEAELITYRCRAIPLSPEEVKSGKSAYLMLFRGKGSNVKLKIALYGDSKRSCLEIQIRGDVSLKKPEGLARLLSKKKFTQPCEFDLVGLKGLIIVCQLTANSSAAFVDSLLNAAKQAGPQGVVEYVWRNYDSFKFSIRDNWSILKNTLNGFRNKMTDNRAQVQMSESDFSASMRLEYKGSAKDGMKKMQAPESDTEIAPWDSKYRWELQTDLEALQEKFGPTCKILMSHEVQFREYSFDSASASLSLCSASFDKFRQPEIFFAIRDRRNGVVIVLRCNVLQESQNSLIKRQILDSKQLSFAGLLEILETQPKLHAVKELIWNIKNGSFNARDKLDIGQDASTRAYWPRVYSLEPVDDIVEVFRYYEGVINWHFAPIGRQKFDNYMEAASEIMAGKAWITVTRPVKSLFHFYKIRIAVDYSANGYVEIINTLGSQVRFDLVDSAGSFDPQRRMLWELVKNAFFEDDWRIIFDLLAAESKAITHQFVYTSYTERGSVELLPDPAATSLGDFELVSKKIETYENYIKRTLDQPIVFSTKEKSDMKMHFLGTNLSKIEMIETAQKSSKSVQTYHLEASEVGWNRPDVATVLEYYRDLTPMNFRVWLHEYIDSLKPRP